MKNTAIYKYFRSKLKEYKENRLNSMSDEDFFIRRHRKIFGCTPDFKNPKTFNEKIVHRILFDRSPVYTALADKLKVRVYVAHRLANCQKELSEEIKRNINASSMISAGGGGRIALI